VQANALNDGYKDCLLPGDQKRRKKSMVALECFVISSYGAYPFKMTLTSKSFFATARKLSLSSIVEPI
jgi:hypothetical protein